jgi:hypothetical protein
MTCKILHKNLANNTFYYIVRILKWTRVSLLEECFVSLILSRIYPAELYKMVCEKNETDLDIHIPAVLLPKDAGSALHTLLTSGNAVSVQLYSPDRPVVDTAEVFLWLMAVGTVLVASYWSAWSAREAVIEQEKLLKVLISMP